MPRDEKLKLKNRRARLDEAIEGNPKSRKLVEDAKPEKKDDYEADFETEAEIIELKEKKKELLNGISGKSEKEKKKIREQLEELNDKIMDLENK